MEAFHKLRQCLLEPPILTFPQFDSPEPFILDTDWSKDHAAIGATISQKQGGVERPIAYGSKRLNPAQSNYGSYKGELFSGTHFMKSWRYYLLPRPFIWRVDNDALRFSKTAEPPDTMVSRWLEIVSQYDFTPQHRAGTQHGNADALSRVDHGEPPDMDTAADSLMHIGQRVLSAIGACLLPLLRDRQALRTAQEADEVLKDVFRWLRTGHRPTSLERHALSRTGRTYLDLLSEMVVDDDGVLCRVTDPNHRDIPVARRPCIPSDHQRDLVLEMHKSVGHMATASTLQRINQSVYFPRMKLVVEDVILRCKPCQAKRKPGADQRHTHVPVPATYPFRRLSIDFVGPMPVSRAGNKFILTVRDVFTRWVEGIPIPAATALNTVRALEREIFCRYGVPEILHSDRGTQFTSNLHHAVAEEYGIQVTPTPAYNPKSNPGLGFIAVVIAL